jgi:hypothetical protein
MVSREDIILFVEQLLGFTPTSDTKFWWDTGTAGFDVVAFWNVFADHYGVDLEGCGQGYDYGDSDGGLGDAMEHLWKRAIRRSAPNTHHFTIDHLVEVANRKKWFDPVFP